MAEEEVNLGDESDDYEVVPVGPIRKLEKRIDNIEQQSGGSAQNEEFVHDVLDIMKSNQKIVNDMTESTHELRNSVEDLTHKMDQVINNMNEFMDLLRDASEMDMEGEVVSDMENRIADAIGNRLDDVVSDLQETNQEVVNSLDDINDNLRKSYASENKDQILRGSSQGSQTGGRGQGGQRPSAQRNRANTDQRTGGSQEGSERLEKLRNRFNKMQNES